LFTFSISFGEHGKSGKPCDRFIAPCSLAKPVITVKMVVPALGSLDDIMEGNFTNTALGGKCGENIPSYLLV
jgi:hypothetical protein